MLFSGGKPLIVTVDDYFAAKPDSKRHPFVNICRDKEDMRSIWPMILEKAYAKLFGSYDSIVGGLVSNALADLTNGIPQRISLEDPDVREQHTTGVFWQKLKFWLEHNYLMGAGTPDGSDSDVSPLGIVQGHAYSVLDATEIDGVKLI